MENKINEAQSNVINAQNEANELKGILLGEFNSLGNVVAFVKAQAQNNAIVSQRLAKMLNCTPSKAKSASLTSIGDVVKANFAYVCEKTEKPCIKIDISKRKYTYKVCECGNDWVQAFCDAYLKISLNEAQKRIVVGGDYDKRKGLITEAEKAEKAEKAEARKEAKAEAKAKAEAEAQAQDKKAEAMQALLDGAFDKALICLQGLQASNILISFVKAQIAIKEAKEAKEKAQAEARKQKREEALKNGARLRKARIEAEAESKRIEKALNA